MNAYASKSTPKALVIAGWVIGILPAAALIMSASMKLMKNPMAVKGFADLGYSDRVIVPLGIVELLCALIYLFPKTAVMGAILMTGYMGGAIATHLRLGQPFILQSVIPILAWLGLFCRDARVRSILPLRG